MAEKPQRESQQGKKRRAEALELEKEAEEWSMPTASGSLGCARKIRLGKRYQAVLPELRTSPFVQSSSSNSSTDVRVNLPRQIFSAQALADSVASNDLHTFLQFSSMLAPGYTHGTAHATAANALHLLHQHNWNITSASCHLLASHAYTPPPTVSSADDAADLPRAKKQQSVPVKHQQWLVAFYLAFATPALTESTLEALRALHRTCPLAPTASEAAVLQDYLTRVDDWITAVEAASNETAASSPPTPPPMPSRKKGSSTPRSAPPTSPADLHALLHTATALRCHELPLARAMTARLDAFELAKTQLLDVLDASVRPSSKSSALTTKKATAAATTSSVSSKSINFDQVKALHAHVRSFGLAFSESAAVDGVLAAAEAVRVEIQALLGQDKVSVPAIRVVLAKVDAIPVDLADDVAPLKVKMTSAQKWLDRARKCMPPTKRQSSRITDAPAVANGRSKMNLDAVHELVQCAPVDDQSSEMQEMEDLLAYADEWGTRVEAAMAAAVPIDTLRELLEEGDDMPVVMELTTGLRAWIDAREWEATALELTAAKDDGKRRKKEGAEGLCSLEDLHDVLDDAADIRRRLGENLARAWQSPIEATIQTTVDAAEAWIAQTQQLLGMATWTKVVGTAKQTWRGSAGDRRAKGSTAATSSAPSEKHPVADLEAVVSGLHRPLPVQLPTEPQPVKDEDTSSRRDTAANLTALVDLTEYLAPLEALITRGKELVAACAGLDVAAADAYETAVGLVDDMDAFPCRLDQGDALREMVAQARTWVAAVHAVCGKQRAPLSYAARVATPTTRRVPKKSSLYDKDVPTPAVAPVAAPTPVPSAPSASLDDLRALEATTLSFSFVDERARIRDEIAAVVAWQARIHDALHSDSATAALAGCRQLQALDAARAAQWTSRRRKAPAAEPTVDDDHAKTAMASVVADKSQVETSADVPKSDDEPAAPAAVAMGDALVSVIQVISGCRTRQPDANDAAADKVAVDWSPMLAEIDRSLGLIAALDAKAKDDDVREATTPHDEEASAAERAAVAAVQAWKTHLEGLLTSLNAIVSTAEVSVVTWLLHALEWVLSSRTHFAWAADADDSDDGDERTSSPLGATIAQGHHLRATVPDSLASNDPNWTQATLWPLEQLEGQRDATKKWEDSLDKQMQDHTLALAHVDAVLAEADAVRADDRPVWIELKKVKTWLIKAKKVLKAKQTAKLPLHTLGNLVDEGGKLRIRTGVWAALQAEHDAAAAWETQLKASGLDVGHAKIATLVLLLREFDDRRFVVDMDMHREVLVSATEQYCICRQPYDGFMLGCELCDDWFHDTCVGISKEKAEKVADYVCPSCGLLHELKRLVGVADELSTELLTNESTSTHEKALGVALRKVKKEERDMDKSTMALVELQTQVTAIGQHVSYLEKMIHDTDKPPALALPSLLQHNHLAHHHALQLFKGYPTPQPSLLRSLPPFPSSSTSVASQQFLQPMPPPSAQASSSPSHGHANSGGGGLTLPPLPNTSASPSPLHLFLAKPTATHGPPDDAAAASGAPPPTAPSAAPSLPTASSSQEIELTRFKMEHFKLKQLAVEADAALAQTKERLRVARAAVDSLVTTRDVWRPKAQHWWQQVQFVLAQLVVDKKAFDLRLLKQWAVESDAFCDAFPAVHAMKKVLHAIPWTIDAFELLHGTPKPSYEALDKVLRENQVHDAKVLLPLRGVLQRTDQWKVRTQKTVTKLLAAKKVETAKIQTVLNEYLKMPLTCSWGRKLEELVAALETRDPILPPPTIEITPPSSPRAQLSSAPNDASATAAPTPALKRKPSGSRSAGGAARKRVKAATDVAEKTVAIDVAKKAKASRGSSRPSTAAPVMPDAVS